MSKDKEIQGPEVNIGDTPRLFIDPSSSCMGYCVAKFNGATCTIVNAGCIWFDPKWTHGQKYNYVQQLIMNRFYVYDAITDIIYERYSFDPNNRMGCLVVPEMIGAIKAACYDVDMELPLGCEDMSPQEWRKLIKLEPIKTPKMDSAGKPITTKAGVQKYSRDYKTPCIDMIDGMFPNQIPDKLVSNITCNARAIPHDVYDAIGLCMGWHRKIGVTKFILSDNAFGDNIDKCE